MRVFPLILASALFTGMVACDSSPSSTEEKIKVLENALKLDPYNVPAHYKLGYIHLLEGNYEEGASQFKDVVRLDKTHARGYRDLGWALFHQKKYLKAKDWLEKALTLNPNDPETIAALSGVQLALGHHKEAERLLHSAVSRGKASIAIYNNLAVAYKNLNKPQKAFLSLEQAITLDPESAETFNNLGIVYETIGMEKAALDSYRAATRFDPDHGPSHYNLAAGLARSKSYQQAIRHFQAAQKLQPEEGETYAGLGFIYKAQKQYNQAIMNYEKSITLDPTQASTRFALGELFDITRQYILAIDAFQMAANLNPRMAEAYYNLGLLYNHINNGKKALVHMTLAGNLYEEKGQNVMAGHCKRNVELFMKKYNISKVELNELLRQKES